MPAHPLAACTTPPPANPGINILAVNIAVRLAIAVVLAISAGVLTIEMSDWKPDIICMKPLMPPRSSLTSCGMLMPAALSPLATSPSPPTNLPASAENFFIASSPAPCFLSFTSPVCVLRARPIPPASSMPLFSCSSHAFSPSWSMPSGDSSFSCRNFAVDSRSAPSMPRSINS